MTVSLRSQGQGVTQDVVQTPRISRPIRTISTTAPSIRMSFVDAPPVASR